MSDYAVGFRTCAAEELITIKGSDMLINHRWCSFGVLWWRRDSAPQRSSCWLWVSVDAVCKKVHLCWRRVLDFQWLERGVTNCTIWWWCGHLMLSGPQSFLQGSLNKTHLRRGAGNDVKPCTRQESVFIWKWTRGAASMQKHKSSLTQNRLSESDIKSNIKLSQGVLLFSLNCMKLYFGTQTRQFKARDCLCERVRMYDGNLFWVNGLKRGSRSCLCKIFHNWMTQHGS